MVRKALGYAAGVAAIVFGLPVVVSMTSSAHGQTEDETPAVVSETRNIGDWLLSCRTVGDNRQCALTQRLTQNDTGAVIFAWTIALDAEGKFVSVWEMPTGVLVDQGVAIDIGAEKPLVIPYRACDTRQCQAAANLGEPFVKELVAAEKVSVSVVATNGQRVAFSLSVNGLEDALAALSE